jgi:hypothetical protein
MEVYLGIRGENGSCVFVKDTETGAVRPLRHVVRHSPTGMEWGYGGSGPADLALSILADALGSVEKADPFYQAFKWQVVTRLSREGFELPLRSVLEWVAKTKTINRPGPPAECNPQLN